LNSLFKQKIRILLFVLLTCFFERGYILASCVKKDCLQIEPKLQIANKYRKKYLSNFLGENDNLYLYEITNKEFEDLLKIDKFKLDLFFLNIVQNGDQIQSGKNSNFNLEIESETQYVKDDVYFAEGSVEVFLPNGLLLADKISYDKNKKIFIAEGNLQFIKGNQYIESEYLEYDSLNEKGYLLNVYGVLDFLNLDKDLNIKEIKNQKPIKNRDDIFNLPSEIQLLNKSNVRFKNKLNLQAINFEFKSITTWRFKTEKIIINKDSWFSEKIYFTNDIFNRPQFIVESKNFFGEIIDKKYKLKSGSTFLIFDDRARIPIGTRNLSDAESKSKWGIGYDEKDKDGLYLRRNFDVINFSNNIYLELQPYFLLQRYYYGESTKFRKKGSSFLDSKKNQEMNIYDSFAFKSKLVGNFEKWDLVLNSYLKSLNFYRINESFSADFRLIKTIYENKTKNFKSDLAIYSEFSKDDIYRSLGLKSHNYFKKNEGGTERNYALIFDVGNFKAKNSKKDKLISSDRLSTNLSLNNKYKLINFINADRKLNSSYKNTPQLINQGIFFDMGIATALSLYSRNYSQSLLKLNFGPSIVIGELKRNFLDYTSLGITYDHVLIKNGESPFAFDEYGSNPQLNLKAQQQIIGPLMIGLTATIDVNNNSKDYGKLTNEVYTLSFSRRAYKIEAFYDPTEEVKGLRFDVYNFRYNNKEKVFK
tara:strand:- start:2633 stop:4741 length:2109 start_codon:yes stop_codon:yes gene_type:complete